MSIRYVDYANELIPVVALGDKELIPLPYVYQLLNISHQAVSVHLGNLATHGCQIPTKISRQIRQQAGSSLRGRPPHGITKDQFKKLVKVVGTPEAWNVDELSEFVNSANKDATDCCTLGGPQEQTIIYREGVIKLGFFIRSKRAKAFRQWATEVICDHLDSSGLDLKDVLVKLDSRLSGLENGQKNLEDGQENLKGLCRGLRDEVDELKAMVGFVYSDKDEEEVRELIRRIKKELEMDGRAIIGHVRKTLNICSIYGATDMRAIKNVLRNLLGEGLRLIENEDTNKE